MARPSRRPGNLPAETTSFIGRRRELAELRQKLGAARLLSVVGPGGVGKTRLALRAAAEVGRNFRDGTWFVGLGEVHDPRLVHNAAMAALDLRDQAATAPHEVVLRFLRDKRILLVFDNCEHLLDVISPIIRWIVTASPTVTVIATSREPLGIQGEHVIPVPPLELPSPQGTNHPHESEAVELFVQRARAASGTFELTRANQSAVADICRRLDGLPLALELAAVRTRALSAEQILERLTDRFALLTGGGRGALPRHQTLETAINWSHDLLTDDERRAFRRLCVFAGRFTLEDAAQVCDASVDVMSSLVDKSLVIKEDATAMARYRLHETMREYAQKKLAQANEVGELSERCTDYYAMRCRATALDARFHLLEWLAWTDLEIDNIRAILRHCMTARDSTRGLDLATALSWFWITRATTEGARWLDELLSLEPSDPANVAWAYFLRGFLGVLQGDWQASLPVLTQGIAWCHRHRLPEQLVHTLSMAAIAEVLAGDRDAAGRYLNSAEELAAQADDVTTRLSILQARSLNAIVAGDAEAAHAAATEGERLSRQAGDLYSRHMMLLNLGGAAILAGDPPASKPVFEEALKLAYQIDDRIGEFYLLAALAYHNATAGRTKIAAQLLGASDAIRTGAGATVMAMLAPFVDQAQEMATNALGETRFRLEFDTGRRLPRDAAVQLALGNSPSTEKPPPNTEDGQLSNRETDVARLVADGLSNKQIGARLFISERTVDSHVRSILNKLGFDSRAQIAGWIAGRGPGF